MTLIRRIMIMGMLMVFAGTVSGEYCPEIQKLRDYYREQRFISLDFLQLTYSEIFETVDSLSGKLWAGWQGRFRLSTPDQALVSNGILYWSYSVENKQALVDSVARLGSWNPLTLLYDPGQVYDCRSQRNTKSGYEFVMVAADSLTMPKQFVILVSKDGYVPAKVVYYDDNDSRIEVFIHNFERQAVLPDSLFEFHPGPGVDVIKMP